MKVRSSSKRKGEDFFFSFPTFLFLPAKEGGICKVVSRPLLPRRKIAGWKFADMGENTKPLYTKESFLPSSNPALFVSLIGESPSCAPHNFSFLLPPPPLSFSCCGHTFCDPALSSPLLLVLFAPFFLPPPLSLHFRTQKKRRRQGGKKCSRENGGIPAKHKRIFFFKKITHPKILSVPLLERV